jgi:protoheme IX farnesyltransferase
MTATTIGAVEQPATLSSWRQTLFAYFMLTKPRIIELLLVTTFPAMVVANHGLPNLWLTLAVLFGGSLAAGGASVVSFVFLTATVNLLTACLALSAILFYVFIYTLWLKRSTVENIVIGGAAGAIPPLCGWAGVTNSLDAAPLIMFAIIFLWTPPHFWALAISYQNDYAQAKVPMLPVVLGGTEARKRSLVYAFVTVAVSMALLLTGDVGIIYGVCATLFGGTFILLAYRQLRAASMRSALDLFRFSTTYLALIFGAMVLDQLIKL